MGNLQRNDTEGIEEMSHKAMDWAVGQTQLDHVAFRVLMIIADCHNLQNGAFPERSTIARRAGVSISTVSKHLAALEAAGLLVRVPRRRSSGHRQSSRYLLAFEEGFAEARRRMAAESGAVEVARSGRAELVRAAESGAPEVASSGAVEVASSGAPEGILNPELFNPELCNREEPPLTPPRGGFVPTDVGTVCDSSETCETSIDDRSADGQAELSPAERYRSTWQPSEALDARLWRESRHQVNRAAELRGLHPSASLHDHLLHFAAEQTRRTVRADESPVKVCAEIYARCLAEILAESETKH